MASGLRKFKFEPTRTSRPSASTRNGSNKPNRPAPVTEGDSAMDPAVKADILASLRGDLSIIIREEFKNALAGDFEALQKEMKAIRTEIAGGMAAMRTEIDQVKANVRVVEEGLSTWSDEVVAGRTTTADLVKQVKELQGKCEDMEGRMRRGNIRIMGVAEQPGSSSPAAVSKLLKEVLRMDKEVTVERSHRSLTQRRPDGKPRVIIAKLHNDGDAMDVLRRARDRGGQLKYDGNPIAIFPDYTAGVAKARAAFTDVRKMLRGRQGVRYGILFPARLRITHNDVEREFVDAAKAMAYVKTKVIPIVETDMP